MLNTETRAALAVAEPSSSAPVLTDSERVAVAHMLSSRFKKSDGYFL